jgi:Na+/melibiose symporter-like transporter
MIDNSIAFGWESLGISVVSLFGYFVLRVMQHQNKDFRKRSISIGIICATILLVLFISLTKSSDGPWIFFVSTMWIFMIGSIIGLFVSEIIQWVIVSFKKD